MPFAYCMSKATDTHSEYAIVIVFPQQQKKTVTRNRFNITLYAHSVLLNYTSRQDILKSFRIVSPVIIPYFQIIVDLKEVG